ncbi:MAG: hypothetical protein J5586_02265, partial [Clostridia bacterium]|nr:hypothetical protein [Clostridia bacterium]
RVLITTDQWGLMERGLYFMNSGKKKSYYGCGGVICTVGAVGEDLSRMRADLTKAGFEFVGEKLGYRPQVAPAAGFEEIDGIAGYATEDPDRHNVWFMRQSDAPIYASFKLPEGCSLMAYRGSETRLHLWFNDGEGCYICDPEGVLIGSVKAYRGDTEHYSGDDPARILLEAMTGHWRIWPDEKYEPTAAVTGMKAAVTLAEGVVWEPEKTMAEMERLLCDAVVAYNTETHDYIEIAFDRGLFTDEQLKDIARSIAVGGVQP